MINRQPEEDKWGWDTGEPEPTACKHNQYEEAITYWQERNPGYCKEGHYLFGVKCGDCSRQFVQDRTEEKSLGIELTFRPTSDCPIYCCVNMKSGEAKTLNNSSSKCQHALCGNCFKKGITRGEAEGRPRSKRTKTRMWQV